MTTGAGVPVGDKLNSMTAGPRGPLLVQDVVFTDEMAHFDRERIPERVVHAKGAGECEYILADPKFLNSNTYKRLKTMTVLCLDRRYQDALEL